jgi:hypothetical protein
MRSPQLAYGLHLDELDRNIAFAAVPSKERAIGKPDRSMDQKSAFFHSPSTRASTAPTLPAETGACYDLKLLNMKAKGRRRPAYPAARPAGKTATVANGDRRRPDRNIRSVTAGNVTAARGFVPQEMKVLEQRRAP